ncbi:hypothetical protein RJZ56_002069 [Blastomyces dermatitidis]|uniref:Uncharacterized protein n=1 Tax=Blastomyces gilchristii (strain SLH14081) TaxID=559298 RepID=A0A179ULR3_BLAGS|nr:uncharacterized protein BDBG_04148 [Blastomyces gilchristii SLH14081]EQL30130.1 hypothetical protein BDFG_07313 [Blastomyces dermatitidis ATCC 26199]OAT08168.1 hypothetical protein BDBG_04148 [Blastomyces gilchristii SLH14081]
MSAPRGSESINNPKGEFHPSAPRSPPMETHGHKPGTKVSPADYAPEFHAQTLPAGSAPEDRTFVSHTGGQPPEERTSAVDALGGADSRELNRGLGQPVWGETSAQLHHDGQAHRKHHGSGLEGVGASSREYVEEEKEMQQRRDFE